MLVAAMKPISALLCFILIPNISAWSITVYEGFLCDINGSHPIAGRNAQSTEASNNGATTAAPDFSCSEMASSETAATTWYTYNGTGSSTNFLAGTQAESCVYHSPNGPACTKPVDSTFHDGENCTTGLSFVMGQGTKCDYGYEELYRFETSGGQIRE